MFHELDDPHKYDDDNEAMDYYTDEYYDDDTEYFEDEPDYSPWSSEWVFKSRKHPQRVYLIQQWGHIIRYPGEDWGEASGSETFPPDRYTLTELVSQIDAQWGVLAFLIGNKLQPGEVHYVTREDLRRYMYRY